METIAKAMSVAAILGLSACVLGEDALGDGEHLTVEVGDDVDCGDDEVIVAEEDGSASCIAYEDIEPGPELFACRRDPALWLFARSQGRSKYVCTRSGGTTYCGTAYRSGSPGIGEFWHYWTRPWGLCSN